MYIVVATSASDRYYSGVYNGTKTCYYTNDRSDAFVFNTEEEAKQMKQILYDKWYGEGPVLVEIHFWIDSWENPKMERMLNGMVDL